VITPEKADAPRTSYEPGCVVQMKGTAVEYRPQDCTDDYPPI